jgi:hypothetical protein
MTEVQYKCKITNGFSVPKFCTESIFTHLLILKICVVYSLFLVFKCSHICDDMLGSQQLQIQTNTAIKWVWTRC